MVQPVKTAIQSANTCMTAMMEKAAFDLGWHWGMHRACLIIANCQDDIYIYSTQRLPVQRMWGALLSDCLSATEDMSDADRVSRATLPTLLSLSASCAKFCCTQSTSSQCLVFCPEALAVPCCTAAWTLVHDLGQQERELHHICTASPDPIEEHRCA